MRQTNRQTDRCTRGGLSHPLSLMSDGCEFHVPRLALAKILLLELTEVAVPTRSETNYIGEATL